jgi:hypothetical protein
MKIEAKQRLLAAPVNFRMEASNALEECTSIGRVLSNLLAAPMSPADKKIAFAALRKKYSELGGHLKAIQAL